MKTLSEWCFNPRDRSIISFAASTAVAKETLLNLKWGHLEDDWENQEIPHISIPPELVKGHGRGRYKGVRQETFLTPEAKQDLLTYKTWIEQRMGRKLTKDDNIYLETREPYEPLSYSRLGVLIWQLSRATGIPFSLHDCRRFVETALEEARLHPNWCRKIRGRKVKGEENPYSRPEIEKLRKAFSDAITLLEFKTPSKPVISKEEIAAELPDEVLAPIAKKRGISVQQLRAIMILKYKTRKEPKTLQQKRRALLEELTLARRKVKKTSRRIISEEQLENDLNHGWRFITVLPSGKILIEKEE